MTRIRSKVKFFSTAMLGVFLLSLTMLPSGGATGVAECPVSVRVIGSTTVGPISDGAKPIFESSWPGTTQVNSNPWEGSGTGINAIRNGTANVGQSSRALTTPESTGIYVYKIAKDGLVIAVRNSGNMGFINTIQSTQVKQIYESGYVGATWDDFGLGGPAQQIVMRSRITTSGTYPDFISSSVGFNISQALEQQTINNSGLPRLQESEDMANAAAGADFVVAYTSLANLDVPNLKALAVNRGTGPVAPNQTTVSNGTYPHIRTLHYMVRENSGSATGTLRIDDSKTVRADDFINFIFTAAGQSFTDDAGFVPIAPGGSPFPAIPDWDVNMDNATSIGDLGAITAKWGQSQSGCPGWIRADANNSGGVSLGDIGVVTGNWGSTHNFAPPPYP